MLEQKKSLRCVSNFEENLKNTFKKLLTRLKLSDILMKSLKCDKQKQKFTAKVVERKWSLKIEQNIYKYI